MEASDLEPHVFRCPTESIVTYGWGEIKCLSEVYEDVGKYFGGGKYQVRFFNPDKWEVIRYQTFELCGKPKNSFKTPKACCCSNKGLLQFGCKCGGI